MENNQKNAPTGIETKRPRKRKYASEVEETQEDGISNEPATHPLETEEISLSISEEAEGSSRGVYIASAHPEEHEQPMEIDFSSMSREDLLIFIRKAADKPWGKNIGRQVQAAKSEFNKKTKEKYADALTAWIDSGGEESEFNIKPEEISEQFNDYLRVYKKNRQQHIIEVNEQKEDNLQKKKDIVEQLRLLTESDETGESFTSFKKLQQQWQHIGHVPPAEAEGLWNNYHFFVERFYEHRSLYSELKELDRKHNLAAKEEVVQKLEALLTTEDFRDAMRQLRQLQEEWRHIGPVPREQVEGVIQRYKAAVIQLYERKEQHSAEMQQRREINLQAKQAILEKVEAMVTEEPTHPQQWGDMNKEINQWLDNWHSIGSVPITQAPEINGRFAAAMKLFKKKKKHFFHQYKRQISENIQKKTEICDKAEALIKEEDTAVAKPLMIALQKEWKASGNVPYKDSEKLWKRFHAANEEFFKIVDTKANERLEQEKENLEKKKAILTQMEVLLSAGSTPEAAELIQGLQEEWQSIGYIPLAEKESTRKKYRTLLEKLQKKGKIKIAGCALMSEFQHFIEDVFQQKDGRYQLDKKMKTLAGEVKWVEKEMAVLNDNIGSFRPSKAADKLINNVKKQIDALVDRKEVAQEKINVIRQLLKERE